jgi:hypothetical protein
MADYRIGIGFSMILERLQQCARDPAQTPVI